MIDTEIDREWAELQREEIFREQQRKAESDRLNAWAAWTIQSYREKRERRRLNRKIFIGVASGIAIGLFLCFLSWVTHQ